jgi:Nif-specific regulatory protein
LAELGHTNLHPDELTALCEFMGAAVKEGSPRLVVRQALSVLHQQTGATLTGFLSLEDDELLPKIILPDAARVDFDLSRQLTQQAQREGRLIWLAGQVGLPLDSESLLSFQDAVCVILRAGEAALGALHMYKTGSAHFSVREVRFCEVLAGYLASSLGILQARRNLEAENSRLREHWPLNEDLIGPSAGLLRVRQEIPRMAPRQHTVLIVGESGVGKELVALALHRHSPRRQNPVVTVNCAAIASSLAEDALFGHVKGAFSGADRDHKGYFQQADEGTLFLDEIGELSLECQAKLLRVIEGKGFLGVGSQKEVKVDVRVVAATHRDLEQEVREGRFRKDLFFRLGIPIRVPPLRDRPEDIAPLVDHFLLQLEAEYHRQVRLSEKALARLREYHWPGNVRQLRSVLEYAVAMTENELVDVDDLRLATERPSTSDGMPGLNLENLEAWAIRQALRQTHSNLSQTARLLGIHRDTLSLKLKKYDIDKEAP